MIRHIAALLLCVFYPTSACACFVTADFQKDVCESLQKWNIPGAAVAVVRDEEVLIQQGYGVQRMGSLSPINTCTLFFIGSLTKAFTATALAVLVDEGKLDWDVPIIRYLPSFFLFNPYVTHTASLRDLLSHRTGLGEYDGDQLWTNTMLSRRAILEHIPRLRPTTPFRSEFAYQNVLYLVAAEVMENATGCKWEKFVQEAILDKLGMLSTLPTLINTQCASNLASSHELVGGNFKIFEQVSIDNIAPAAGIVSNVQDMTKWIKFNLNFCDWPNSFFEMIQPQIMINPSALLKKIFPFADCLSYGLGWFLFNYSGIQVILHDGYINGMSSLMLFLPEKKIGMVILANMKDTLFPFALAYKLLDQISMSQIKNWDDYYMNVQTQLSSY